MNKIINAIGEFLAVMSFALVMFLFGWILRGIRARRDNGKKETK